MKLTYTALATFFILLISSCSITKKLEKELVGKYAVEMLKSSSEEQAGNTSANILKGLLEGSYIQFNENKTYELSLAKKITKGTWHFSDDGKTILTDKKNIKFRINKFTDNGLELKSYNNKDVVLMILKKISG
ncbi:MAG: hypothetical protein L3J56_03025 [Bacteroidales bacterium]|nr:hypothetical protein [Bacteroidales bacterium]